MFVLLELYYKLITQKGKYQYGWKKYTIYPFIFFMYMIKVMFVIEVYMRRINNIIDFRTLILEYVSFLTVIERTTNNDSININNQLRYNTTKIHVQYTDENVIKNISYHFMYEGYDGTTRIKVFINETLGQIIIDLHTNSGITSFSYKSLVDARMVGMKDSIELIIRKDIAANLKYILLKNRY